MLRHLRPGTILGVIAIVLALVGTATASSLITSKNIADGTIRNRDIHEDQVSLNRLSPGVQKLISGNTGATRPAVNGRDGAQGPQGPKGDRGDTGPQGSKGDKGDPAATPLTFGPYDSGSEDSGVAGNNWATDSYKLTFVLNPQPDGSMLVNALYDGSFVTHAGPSPNDGSVMIPAGIRGTFVGRNLFKIEPTDAQHFDPHAAVQGQVTKAKWFKAFFGIDDVDQFTTHGWVFDYKASGHGTWHNADSALGGNSGNIVP